MSDRRMWCIVGVVMLVVWLMLCVSEASAQGAIVPTPPPVTPPPPVNPVDAANARADQWQAVANQAVSSAQASINAAYGALANAQWGLNQAQAALQQESAARIAAQQGQIQQAVDSAHQAQMSAARAIVFVSQASDAALESIRQSGAALQLAAELRSSLTAVTAQRETAVRQAEQLDQDRAALAGALVAERARSDVFGKVAIGALLLLGVTLVYIAVVLWKLVRALRIQPRDRVVVLDERGRVKAQIEALH